MNTTSAIRLANIANQVRTEVESIVRITDERDSRRAIQRVTNPDIDPGGASAGFNPLQSYDDQIEDRKISIAWCLTEIEKEMAKVREDFPAEV